MKRFLHLFHRWAGIVLCAFFSAWFFSGLFMMYVEFPQLTRPERLAAAPALDFASAKLTAADAVTSLEADGFKRFGTPTAIREKPPEPGWQAKRVRLVMRENRPAYEIYPDNGAQPAVVFADTGERLRDVSPAQAVAAVNRHAAVYTARFVETLLVDQWTVSSAMNPHRPLLRVALDDKGGREFYVSSTTGEVVRDTARRERVLNYFGAVVHWIYPTALRKFPDAWAWVVDVLAAAGTMLALSGLWVGVLRFRRRVPAPRSTQQRLIRWHYATGAIFGIVTLTWVFSGWMSMNPGKLNPPRTPTAAESHALTGGPLAAEKYTSLPGPSLPPDAVEAELLRYDGQPFYHVTTRDQTTRLASAAAPGSRAPRLPAAEALIARAPALLPGASLASADVLTSYDDYYYSRHPEYGGKPLPIVRVTFSDAEKTWFHLDPVTGQVLERSTARNRLFRHLYNGLHSFDWWWLWSRRPLWDVVVITFSLGGGALSILGVVLGLRRLRAELCPRSNRFEQEVSSLNEHPRSLALVRSKNSASS